MLLIFFFFLLFVQCKELLGGLLQHGSLTLKQIVEREKSSKREGESLLNVILFSIPLPS